MLAPRKPDHFELQGRKAKAPSQISFWHLLPDPFRHFRERPKAQNFPYYPCYMGNELSNMYTIPQNRYPAMPYTLEFSHVSPLKMYKEKKTVSESSNCGKLGHWSVRTSRWCFRRLEPIACHSRLPPWQLRGHPKTKGIPPHGAVHGLWMIVSILATSKTPSYLILPDPSI